jgi:hypothetical protein
MKATAQMVANRKQVYAITEGKIKCIKKFAEGHRIKFYIIMYKDEQIVHNCIQEIMYLPCVKHAEWYGQSIYVYFNKL